MDPSFAVFADFGSRPAALTNAVVRHHRCAVASTYVVVTAGGHLKVDFVVPDHLNTAEAVLRLETLGTTAPMDVVLNGETVAKEFRLPEADTPDAPREYVLSVPGTALLPGVNVLQLRNADGDGAVLRLRTLALDPVEAAERARRTRAARDGGPSVRTYATERRPLGAPVWQPGPTLTVHLDQGGTPAGPAGQEPPARLAWRGTDGTESSVAFRTDLSGFHGHVRGPEGSLGEVRGALTGTRPRPEGPLAARVRHFVTEEEHDGVWRPAGRLGLLLDDGAPLERVTWSGRGGTATSVSLVTDTTRGAGPAGGERRDITDRVREVQASDEFTAAGEVAPNLLRTARTKWLAQERDPEVTFTFDSPLTVTAYSLTSANDFTERDPADWTLEGSHDGRTWMTLDIRQDQHFRRRFETKEYVLATTGAFSHYRLNIGDNCGDHLTQLSAVRFFDAGEAAPASDTLAFIGYRQAPGAEPVGYRGTSVPAPAEGIAATAGGDTGEEEELLVGDFSGTAQSLQEAAQLLERLTRYLRR
ncbi:alpha-1,2-mannosidase [Streptomyces jietaisiensis]|uniref:alpha-1,2-mannosidase n=1 Tax=Streptomyces griseoaurantiacus TaxID=68213 RepID=UPI0032523AB9